MNACFGWESIDVDNLLHLVSLDTKKRCIAEIYESMNYPSTFYWDVWDIGGFNEEASASNGSAATIEEAIAGAEQALKQYGYVMLGDKFKVLL